MKVLPGIAIAIAAGVVVGATLYVAQRGESEQLIPDKSRPKVAGRLTSGYVGENESGGFTGRCEFDAFVRIEKGKIAQVFDRGNRPEVKIGDEVVDVPVDPENPSDTDHDIGVYWGDDAKLHFGCAPESVIYQGGQEIPIKDLPSPPAE